MHNTYNKMVKNLSSWYVKLCWKYNFRLIGGQTVVDRDDHAHNSSE